MRLDRAFSPLSGSTHKSLLIFRCIFFLLPSIYNSSILQRCTYFNLAALCFFYYSWILVCLKCRRMICDIPSFAIVCWRAAGDETEPQPFKMTADSVHARLLNFLCTDFRWSFRGSSAVSCQYVVIPIPMYFFLISTPRVAVFFPCSWVLLMPLGFHCSLVTFSVVL